MLFSRKPKQELALLLDIQSSIIRGSIVLFSPGSVPQFIFTYSLPISFKTNATSGYLVKKTLHSLHIVTEVILKEMSLRNSSGVMMDLPKKINQVHFILSSPWIVSQAKTLKLSFAKNIKVTPEKIRPYLEKEREKLIGDDKDQLIIIEEKVFDIRLNGYSVTHWQEKMTNNLEISFVISVAGSKLIKSFSNTVQKMVPHNRIFFHSSLLLQNIGIQRVLKTHADYSLIHVHGEITDVVIINNHSCIFFGSFPLGINTLIRKIAYATKNDQRSAESLLSLFINGQLDPHHSVDLQKIIKSIREEWSQELLKLINNSTVLKSSLDEIIISAHSYDNFFLEILKNIKSKSNITLLKIGDIQSHIHFAPQTEKLRILGLCATAINSGKA